MLLVGILLCYSSLLRTIGNILIFESDKITTKTLCVHCSHAYCWKCLVPFSDYIFHKGKHSFPLYTVLILDIICVTSLFLLLKTAYPFTYLCSYLFFFSALLITIYTDMRHMLISRFVTLYSIPIVLILSIYNFIPLSPVSSIIGALSGYSVLYAIALIFYRITKKEGLGQGDIDLIAFIGSFIGFLGWWATLLIGSFTASMYGITFMLITRQSTSIKLPFGPFLALGAILYIIMQDTILALLFAF